MIGAQWTAKVGGVVWTNPHHLLLFYYVARHGGISRALPHIGYGIQQPALSGQMLAFEREVGTPLFIRKPFALTAAGQSLYDHVVRFYEPIQGVLAKIRHLAVPSLSIGASELITREYLPGVLTTMREGNPRLQFELFCGTPAELVQALGEGKLDLVIAALPRPPAGFAHLVVTKLPLVLVRPKSVGLENMPDLTKPGRVSLPLVAAGPGDETRRVFDRELRKRKVEWPVTTTINSIAMVSWLVANSPGFGVSLDLDVLVRGIGVKAERLPGFEAVKIMALWRRKKDPLLLKLVEVITEAARRLAVKR